MILKYILDLISSKEEENMIPVISKRETGWNIRILMDKYNLTVKDVQEYLGLGSQQSIYHWLNGISMPTIDNLYALSSLFCVSMDDIVRGNKSDIKDYSYRRLFRYYNILKKYVA